MKPLHAFTALLVLFLPGETSAAGLLLKNARLVDPTSRTVQLKDILIVEGRIAPMTSRPADQPIETLDLSGHWVIPGLIDLHVHSYGNVFPNDTDEDLDPRLTARLMLYCGVTAYLELGTRNLDDIFSIRNGQRAGGAAAGSEADIYCAGVAFGPWSLTSPTKARENIASYIKQWRPDVIKILNGSFSNRNGITPETLQAVVEVARQSGIKTVVHISKWENARATLRAGATAITHFDDDEIIPDDLVQLWAATPTISIPTMAVQSDMANLTGAPALLDSPLLRAVAPPAGIQSYRDPAHFSPKARRAVRWQQDDMANDTRTFHKLAAAGITLLTGSDTCNLGTFQGFSLHREIKLMQDAGYPAWDALAAATTRAAAFLGRPSGIQPGEIAELVVLDADPLVDTANTQKISAVIHHGRLVDRPALLPRPPQG